MGWFSILPASLAFIETWIVRVFLLLGFAVTAPWLLLIVYDALLYAFRVITYDIPVIGGRARNRPRPRAPSLSERPSGRPRGFSLAGVSSASNTATAETSDGLKNRSKRAGHSRSTSSAIMDEQ